jgi:hypothetical protein
MAKPNFGPYHTLSIVKLDSPVILKKTKDSSDFGISISGSGSGANFSKFMTIKKKKFYKLSLAGEKDTTHATFSIFSTSKEKKQTLLGKILSKDDDEENKSEVLSYNRDVSGVIETTSDSTSWIFFIQNFRSGSRETANNPYRLAAIGSAYLKNETDSIFISNAASFASNITLSNATGETIAKIEPGKELVIWIREDVEDTYKNSIAAFFAVIIGIKDM